MTTSTSSPAAVTSRSGEANAGEWYATTAHSAPHLQHLLPPGPARVSGAGLVGALCGEQRREWWPVRDWAYAAKFDQCADCISKVLEVVEHG